MKVVCDNNTDVHISGSSEELRNVYKLAVNSMYGTGIYKDIDGVYHKIDRAAAPLEKLRDDNLLQNQIEYLTRKLYNQLGIPSEIMNTPLYPETVLTTSPVKILRNFCSENNISFKVKNVRGRCAIEFSRCGRPFTASFDSYGDYIGMSRDTAGTIIDKLKAIYNDHSFKIWANSFYGMSSGGRPSGNPFENAVVEYCKEDVKATMEISQFYADFTKSVKDNVDFNRIRNTKLGIEKVIFNKEATVVLWKDGTKTVVKCQDGDNFDKEKGLAMAICKKALGTNESHSNFNDIFKKWITED